MAVLMLAYQERHRTLVIRVRGFRTFIGEALALIMHIQDSLRLSSRRTIHRLVGRSRNLLCTILS